MSADPVASIEAAGLVREFKKGPRAVDGIDLHVRPGEIYGFLGPNGAGKSTTVLMLTTLLPPTAGSASVAGHDVVREGPQVRSAIGAALQEAALDPLLTGAEHMRLQTALHGFPRAERSARGTELLERVGLIEAADRKVGGYSGGMKRRLDLALALVHRPRVLFLDEPTTGLDVQSRTALWDEVSRLAAEDGVTVFLTTQYLEEADVLADRVGIIDHGRIVAEGTPTALKNEIGRPSVEVVPRAVADRDKIAAVLERFGERTGASPKGVAVRLRGGERDLADVVRALDAEQIAVEHIQLHAPSLDDVFLAKTGRSLEGSGGAGSELGGPEADGRYRADQRSRSVSGSALLIQVGQLARRSVLRTLRQPAQIVPALIFPLFLLAVNTGGLQKATRIPGFPTHSYLTFALAIPFIQGALFSVMNSGTDLARDIESGFLNRLSLTPLRGPALLAGLLAGAIVLALIQAVTYLLVGLAAGANFATGFPGVLVIIALSVLITLGFGGIGLFAALRTGSGEAVQGLFPLFFVSLFLSSMALPRNLIHTEWFREVATYNPVSYLIEAIRSLLITGWDGKALALGFGIAAAIAVLAMTAASYALRTRLVRT